MTTSMLAGLPTMALELIAGEIPEARTAGMRALAVAKAAAAKELKSCEAQLQAALDALPTVVDGLAGQGMAGQLRNCIAQASNAAERLDSEAAQLNGGADDFDLIETQVYVIGVIFVVQVTADLMVAGGFLRIPLRRMRAKLGIKVAVEQGLTRMEMRGLAESAARQALPSPGKIALVGTTMGAGFGAATPLIAQWWEKEVKGHGEDKPYHWRSVAEGAYSGAIGGGFGAFAAFKALPLLGSFVNRVAAKATGTVVPRVLGTVTTMVVGGGAGLVGGAAGLVSLLAIPGTKLTENDWKQALITGLGGGVFGTGGAIIGGFIPHPASPHPGQHVWVPEPLAEPPTGAVVPEVALSDLSAAADRAPAHTPEPESVDVPATDIIADLTPVSRPAQVLVRHVDATGVARFLVITAPYGGEIKNPLLRLPSTGLDAEELPMPGAAHGLRERLGVPPDYPGTLHEVETRVVHERDGRVVTRIVVEASDRFESVVDASADGIFTENAQWMTPEEMVLRHTNRMVNPGYATIFHDAVDNFPPVRAPADNVETMARLGSRMSLDPDDVARAAHNMMQRSPAEQHEILAYFAKLNNDIEISNQIIDSHAYSFGDHRDHAVDDFRLQRDLDTLEKRRALASHPDIAEVILTPMVEGILTEVARSEQWKSVNVNEVVDFLRRPAVAADLRTIAHNNPDFARYVGHRLWPSADLAAFARDLHKVAAIPAGAVGGPLLNGFGKLTDQRPLGDFSPESLAARDRGRITTEDRAWSFLLSLEDFSPPSVMRQFAYTFLEAGQFGNLPEHVHKEVSFTAEQLRGVEDTYLDAPYSLDFTRYVEAVGALPPDQQSPAIRVAAQLVREVRPEFVRCVQDLLREGSSERAALGLRLAGDDGIAELKELAGSFTSAVRGGELSPENVAKVQKSDFIAHLLIDVTHYASSDWGPHGMDQLRALLDYHTQKEKEGRIDPMPEEYQPSEVLDVAKLRTRPEWTEDLLTRYRVLATDLADARAVLTGVDEPFTHLLDRLGRHLADHVDALDRSVASGTLSNGLEMNDKAKQSMAARADELRTLTLSSLTDFQQNFASVARVGDLYSDLRTISFAMAMQRHPEWVDQLSVIRPDEPTLDHVGHVREFIEHITNQEVFGNYFSEQRAANVFRRMTSTLALEQAMLRTQGVGVSSDSVPVRFVPSRGPLLELSGHIASACWAGKYDSVAEAMPNMTSVTMVLNPDNPAKTAFAGAALLIETTSDAGDPILLIRGLNPLQTFINHVSANDFLQQFTMWAHEIAEARGSRLAIVIDNHCGGSATNRPVLYGELAPLRSRLTPVRVDAADTTFNGYNVTNDAYLIG